MDTKIATDVSFMFEFTFDDLSDDGRSQFEYDLENEYDVFLEDAIAEATDETLMALRFTIDEEGKISHQYYGMEENFGRDLEYTENPAFADVPNQVEILESLLDNTYVEDRGYYDSDVVLTPRDYYEADLTWGDISKETIKEIVKSMKETFGKADYKFNKSDYIGRVLVEIPEE